MDIRAMCENMREGKKSIHIKYEVRKSGVHGMPQRYAFMLLSPAVLGSILNAHELIFKGTFDVIEIN